MVVSQVCKYCGYTLCVCSPEDREKRRKQIVEVVDDGVSFIGTSEVGDSIGIYMKHLTLKDDGGNNIVLKGDPEIYEEFERVFSTIHEWMKRFNHRSLKKGGVVIDKYEIETMRDVFKKLTEIYD